MSGSPCITTAQARFLDLLNGLRQRHGLPPLQVDANLHAAATFRANDMVTRNYFSHETPGHGSAGDVVEEFGYDADLTGENICWGEKTAEEAFDTWVTSPDHFDNMTSPHYVAVGIGGPAGIQFKDQKWGVWVTPFGSTLMTASAVCDANEVATAERPDRPPRTERLPRERPPREMKRRRERERERDERLSRRERERDRNRDRDRRDRDRDRERERGGEGAQPVHAGETAFSGAAAGGPAGPIRTVAPWGSFGVEWDRINRWDSAIQQAASEFGVPAERIKAHIVIESAGNPEAIQRNDQNGWSFGLMQVVPRWWSDRILELAGQSGASLGEHEVGQLLIDDPALAVRAGTAVLSTFFEGDWDRASSKFFLGNPDWRGADTVNGNTGDQYRMMLNGLIAEITSAGAGSGTAVATGTTGTTTTATTVAERPVQFGRVPHPTFVDRLIPDANNVAWDNIGQRTVKGVVYHRQLGGNWGTDAYFRLMPPGGQPCPPAGTQFNWGGCNGLTDYGIDHVTGEILRWNDPTGQAHPGVSPNRSAWASGPVSDPYGDGLAFLQDHGMDENVVNRDQASIEISGFYRDPVTGHGVDEPLSEACKNAVAALSAYFADQLGIRHDQYPFLPGKDYSFVRWHHEFTRGTGKFCPGKDVMEATQDIINRTKAILKEHQTGA
jgi:hypothetical protein